MRIAEAQGGVQGMRMMVAFEKGASLRYIGHLDLMRTVQRALRRSNLPIKYSNGFNPHIRLSFAAPLSVGVIGLHELMEVPLEDGVTEQQFMEGMNAALPACLRIRSCRAVDDAFPALMSLVAGADYRITFAKTEEGMKAAKRFDDFMALDSYIAQRRTKSGENPCDIRPFVLNGSCMATADDYQIELRTLAMQAGMLKPSLWFECLREYAQCGEIPHLIYRVAILAKNGAGQLVPMEEV